VKFFIHIDGDIPMANKEVADEKMRVMLSQIYDLMKETADSITGEGIVYTESDVIDLVINTDGWIQDWSEPNGNKEITE
jgi:hypothetical protein